MLRTLSGYSVILYVKIVLSIRRSKVHTVPITDRALLVNFSQYLQDTEYLFQGGICQRAQLRGSHSFQRRERRRPRPGLSLTRRLGRRRRPGGRAPPSGQHAHPDWTCSLLRTTGRTTGPLPHREAGGADESASGALPTARATQAPLQSIQSCKAPGGRRPRVSGQRSGAPRRPPPAQASAGLAPPAGPARAPRPPPRARPAPGLPGGSRGGAPGPRRPSGLHHRAARPGPLTAPRAAAAAAAAAALARSLARWAPLAPPEVRAAPSVGAGGRSRNVAGATLYGAGPAGKEGPRVSPCFVPPPAAPRHLEGCGTPGLWPRPFGCELASLRAAHRSPISRGLERRQQPARRQASSLLPVSSA
ncbi:uncharacterized protein [Vulpes vulpes]|uniref:Basic proline-rich protein-like n=1 Tax=Vulpes vulpes TaxID=9627 RepID=A0ABM4YVB8_VULVU